MPTISNHSPTALLDVSPTTFPSLERHDHFHDAELRHHIHARDFSTARDKTT